MKEKEQALLEIIAVRPWFTVDTHLGTPLVSLSENTAFDGELYALDASGDRQTFLEAPPPQPLPPRPPSAPLGVSTTTESTGITGAGETGGGATARATKAHSAQDEVKVSLEGGERARGGRGEAAGFISDASLARLKCWRFFCAILS